MLLVLVGNATSSTSLVTEQEGLTWLRLHASRRCVQHSLHPAHTRARSYTTVCTGCLAPTVANYFLRIFFKTLPQIIRSPIEIEISAVRAVGVFACDNGTCAACVSIRMDKTRVTSLKRTFVYAPTCHLHIRICFKFFPDSV